jgi:hypothetical protein
VSVLVTRALDDTGNPTLDAIGTWSRATSPSGEMVRLALRTQLGACVVDPELGVDWRRIQKLRTSAPADAETAIRAGLARLLRLGLIRDLAVRVKVRAAVGRIDYEVDYRDTSSAAPLTVLTVSGSNV